jgi:hypothetical protein
MVSWHWRAATGWLIFAVLAALLAAAAWSAFDGGALPRPGAPAARPAGSGSAAWAHGHGESFALSLLIAAGALLAGAATYLWMTRVYPLTRAAPA